MLAVLLPLVASIIGADRIAADVKARLLAAYDDPATRPTESGARAAAAAGHGCAAVAPPEEVQTQLYIDRFHNLDQRHQTFGFDGYLRSWWQDPRLRFNSTADGGCTDKLSFTRLESAQIWKPGFYWEDAVKVVLPKTREMVDTGAGELFEVLPDGRIFWSQQVSMTISCELDLYKMPFDTQHCTYLMGLYSQTAAEVKLSWRQDEGVERTAFAGAASACIPEFVLTSVEQDSPVFVYEHNYTYARAVLRFSRWPDPLVLHYLIPGALLVIVAMAGFFIDAKATPARVALGIIGILAVLTNISQLTQLLPPGSDTVWLHQFLLVSFAFNGLAFFEQVAVSFGLQAASWRETQRRILEVNRNWKLAIARNREALSEVFAEWDANGDGRISKREFRDGVAMLHLSVPNEEINRLFDQWDVDGNGTLTLDELKEKMATLSQNSGGPASQLPVVTGKIAEETDDDEAEEEPPALERDSLQDPTDALEHPNDRTLGVRRDVVRGPKTQPTQRSISEASTNHCRSPRRAKPVLRSGRAPTCTVTLPAVRSARTGQPMTQLWPRAPMPPSPPSSPASGNTPWFESSKSRSSQVKSRKSGRESHAANQFSRRMKESTRKSVKEDLDVGCMWSFKYYHLFPQIEKLRFLDHISRVVFPIAYLTMALVFGAGVGFGTDSPLSGETGSGKFPCLDKKQLFGDGSQKFGFAGY